MPSIRLTRKQAARLIGEDVPTQKTRQPRQEAVRSEKPVSVVLPAVGQKWRVVKGLAILFGDTPPLVGTVLTIWWREGDSFYMEEDTGRGFMFPVTPEQLGRYFEEVKD